MKEETKQILREDVVQLIVFNLGEEEFGVKIEEIREIIETKHITSIPDSPGFIKGLINVRGEIVAAIDLKARFFLIGEKDYESKHIIIAQQEKNLFGLMVDEVTEVLRLPKANIKLAPEILTKTNREYVKGVVSIGNRLIILLDLEKVLSEEELMKLGELGKKHYKKIEETKSEDLKKDKFLEGKFLKDEFVDSDEKVSEMEDDKKSEKQKKKETAKNERINT